MDFSSETNKNIMDLSKINNTPSRKERDDTSPSITPLTTPGSESSTYSPYFESNSPYSSIVTRMLMQVYAANGQCEVLNKELLTLNKCLEEEKSKSSSIEAEKSIVLSINNELKDSCNELKSKMSLLNLERIAALTEQKVKYEKIIQSKDDLIENYCAMQGKYDLEIFKLNEKLNENMLQYQQVTLQFQSASETLKRKDFENNEKDVKISTLETSLHNLNNEFLTSQVLFDNNLKEKDVEIIRLGEIISQKGNQIVTMNVMLKDSQDYYNDIMILKTELQNVKIDRHNSDNEISRVNNINKLLLEQIEEHNAVISSPSTTTNTVTTLNTSYSNNNNKYVKYLSVYFAFPLMMILLSNFICNQVNLLRNDLFKNQPLNITNGQIPRNINGLIRIRDNNVLNTISINNNNATYNNYFINTNLFSPLKNLLKNVLTTPSSKSEYLSDTISTVTTNDYEVKFHNGIPNFGYATIQNDNIYGIIKYDLYSNKVVKTINFTMGMTISDVILIPNKNNIKSFFYTKFNINMFNDMYIAVITSDSELHLYDGIKMTSEPLVRIQTPDKYIQNINILKDLKLDWIDNNNNNNFL